MTKKLALILFVSMTTFVSASLFDWLSPTPKPSTDDTIVYNYGDLMQLYSEEKLARKNLEHSVDVLTDRFEVFIENETVTISNAIDTKIQRYITDLRREFTEQIYQLKREMRSSIQKRDKIHRMIKRNVKDHRGSRSKSDSFEIGSQMINGKSREKGFQSQDDNSKDGSSSIDTSPTSSTRFTTKSREDDNSKGGSSSMETSTKSTRFTTESREYNNGKSREKGSKSQDDNSKGDSSSMETSTKSTMFTTKSREYNNGKSREKGSRTQDDSSKDDSGSTEVYPSSTTNVNTKSIENDPESKVDKSSSKEKSKEFDSIAIDSSSKEKDSGSRRYASRDSKNKSIKSGSKSLEKGTNSVDSSSKEKDPGSRKDDSKSPEQKEKSKKSRSKSIDDDSKSKEMNGSFKKSREVSNKSGAKSREKGPKSLEVDSMSIDSSSKEKDSGSRKDGSKSHEKKDKSKKSSSQSIDDDKSSKEDNKSSTDKKGSKEDKKGSKEDKKGSIEDNKSSKDKKGSKEDKKSSKEDKKGSKEDKKGSKEDKKGSKEDDKSSKEDKKGSKEDKKGSKEDKKGSKEDNKSSKEDKKGSKEDKKGSKEDKKGSKEDNKSSKDDKKGSKEDKKGSKEDRKSSKEDMKGSKEDKKGSKEDKKGSKEDNKVSTGDKSSKTSGKSRENRSKSHSQGSRDLDSSDSGSGSNEVDNSFPDDDYSSVDSRRNDSTFSIKDKKDILYLKEEIKRLKTRQSSDELQLNWLKQRFQNLKISHKCNCSADFSAHTSNMTDIVQQLERSIETQRKEQHKIISQLDTNVILTRRLDRDFNRLNTSVMDIIEFIISGYTTKLLLNLTSQIMELRNNLNVLKLRVDVNQSLNRSQVIDSINHNLTTLNRNFYLLQDRINKDVEFLQKFRLTYMTEINKMRRNITIVSQSLDLEVQTINKQINALKTDPCRIGDNISRNITHIVSELKVMELFRTTQEIETKQLRQIANLSSQNTDMKIQNLKDQINVIKVDTSKHAKTVARLDQDIGRITSEVNSLQKFRSTHIAELAKVRQETTAVSQKIKNDILKVNQEINAIKSDTLTAHNKLNQNITRIALDIGALQNFRLTQVAALNELGQRITLSSQNIEMKIQNLNGEINVLKSNYLAFGQNMNITVRRLEMLKSTHVAELNQLRQTITLNTQNIELKMRNINEQINSFNSNSLTAVTKVSSNITRIVSELAALQRSTSTHASDISQLRQENALTSQNIEMRIQKVNNEILMIKSNSLTHLSDVNKLSQNISGIIFELQTFNVLRSTLTTDLSQLRQETTMALQNIETKIQTTSREINVIKSENLATISNISSTERRLDSLRSTLVGDLAVLRQETSLASRNMEMKLQNINQQISIIKSDSFTHTTAVDKLNRNVTIIVSQLSVLEVFRSTQISETNQLRQMITMSLQNVENKINNINEQLNTVRTNSLTLVDNLRQNVTTLVTKIGMLRSTHVAELDELIQRTTSTEKNVESKIQNMKVQINTISLKSVMEIDKLSQNVTKIVLDAEKAAQRTMLQLNLMNTTIRTSIDSINRNVTSNLQKTEADSQRLENEILMIKSNSLTHVSDVNKLSQNISGIIFELQTFNVLRSTLTTDLSQLRQKTTIALQNIETKIQTTSHEINVIKTENLATISNISSTERRLDSLRSTLVGGLAQLRQETSVASRNMEMKLQNINQQISIIKSDSITHATAVDNLNRNISIIVSQLSVLEVFRSTQISETNQLRQIITMSVQNVENKINNINEQLNTMKTNSFTSVDNLRQNVTTLVTKIEMLRSTHVTELDELRQRTTSTVKNIESQIQNLNVQMNTISLKSVMEINQLSQNVTRMVLDAEKAAQRTMLQLNLINTTIRTSIDSINRNVTSISQKTEADSQRLEIQMNLVSSSLKNEIILLRQNMTRRLLSVDTETDRLRIQISSMESSFLTSVDQLSRKLNVDMQMTVAEIQGMDLRINTLSGSIEQMKYNWTKLLQRTEADDQRLNTEVTLLKTQTDNLKLQLDTFILKVNNMESTHVNLNHKVNRFENITNDFKGQLDFIQTETTRMIGYTDQIHKELEAEMVSLKNTDDQLRLEFNYFKINVTLQIKNLRNSSKTDSISNADYELLQRNMNVLAHSLNSQTYGINVQLRSIRRYENVTRLKINILNNTYTTFSKDQNIKINKRLKLFNDSSENLKREWRKNKREIIGNKGKRERRLREIEQRLVGFHTDFDGRIVGLEKEVDSLKSQIHGIDTNEHRLDTEIRENRNIFADVSKALKVVDQTNAKLASDFQLLQTRITAYSNITNARLDHLTGRDTIDPAIEREMQILVNKMENHQNRTAIQIHDMRELLDNTTEKVGFTACNAAKDSYSAFVRFLTVRRSFGLDTNSTYRNGIFYPPKPGYYLVTTNILGTRSNGIKIYHNETEVARGWYQANDKGCYDSGSTTAVMQLSPLDNVTIRLSSNYDIDGAGCLTIVKL